MNKAAIIRALSEYDMDVVVLVPDQDISDIMVGIKAMHKCYAHMYDKIAAYFDESQGVEELCFDLWKFCKENLEYQEQTTDEQWVSMPGTILSRGFCDCKEYALFIAGVLDAKRRKGLEVDWMFRFVPSKMLGMNIGHVFVVANPGNIWVDPVLGNFDQHYPYFVKKDEVVSTASKIAGLQLDQYGRMAIGSAEDDLLASVKNYSDGVDNAIKTSFQTNTLNSISTSVLQSASSSVPGLTQALSFVKAGQVILNNTFGVGSFAARLFSDFSTGNVLTAPIAVIKTLLNPGARTFNSDQYAAAQMYQYNVLGKSNITNQNQISDGDVPVALKWFIDRLGVFISGRQHINALIESPQKYVSYYGVNGDTTTDMSRVGPASAVAQQYFYQTGSQPAGLWAGTVGVYDEALVALANQLGESVEQVDNQVASGQLADPRASANPMSIQNPIVWVAAFALVGILITSKPKTRGKK